MHQWITDSGFTPYVVVDVTVAGVDIPPGYAQDGKIVLNVSYTATDHLDIGSEALEFSARFGGVARHLKVPLTAVLALYASENGQGMLFDAEEEADVPPEAADAPKPAGGGVKRPTLKVIK
jgi:stringent starvation protein B